MAAQAGIRAAKAFVEIGVHSKLQAGLAKASAQLTRFGKQIRGLGQNVGSVGTRMTGMGVVGAAAIGGVMKLFAAFDDQMRITKAVTGANADQFSMLTEEAKRLGRETSFTASQVAEGMANLGRGGFKPEEIMDSLESMLGLSRATATDLADTTQIAAGTLRGFGLDASEMGRVADVLTYAMNNSTQTLTDFGEGVRYVAPLARAAGESIEDVAAASMILADNNIRGSLAGNALARAYKNLSTTARQDILASIGVQAVDAQGNLRKLADIMRDLGKATEGQGNAKRLALFEVLFGRGQAAALNLSKDEAKFDGAVDALFDGAVGAAVKTAKGMDAGIGGAFRMLYSAVEGVFIEIGETLEPIIRGWADALKKFAGSMQRVIERTPELATGFLKIVAATIAGGLALVAIGAAMKTLGISVIATGLIVKGFAATLGFATAAMKALGLAVLAFNPLTLYAAVAVGTVTTALVMMSDSAAESTRTIAEDFRMMGGKIIEAWQGISAAISTGNLALAGEIALAALRLVFDTGLGAIRRLWIDWTYDLANALVVIETTAKKVMFNVASFVSGLGADIAKAAGLDSVGNILQIASNIQGAVASVQTEVERRVIGDNERARDAEKAGIAAGIAEMSKRLSELNAQAMAEAAELLKPEPEKQEREALTRPVSADSLAITPESAVQNLGGVANRGTFSSFVASRIGTRTTYEDKSLSIQERTAKATEAIEAQMEIANAIGV